LSEPRDAVENLVSSLGPDKRFRTRMMRLDELANGRLQLRHAAVDAAPQLFVGQLREPALDEVQPGPYVGVKWT
jgi:hypothetical protein